jgi:hypothetical protein
MKVMITGSGKTRPVMVPSQCPYCGAGYKDYDPVTSIASYMCGSLSERIDKGLGAYFKCTVQTPFCYTRELIAKYLKEEAGGWSYETYAKRKQLIEYLEGKESTETEPGSIRPERTLIDALEAGRMYAVECLMVHDDGLGRTTDKNIAAAEEIEKDIRVMDEALNLLGVSYEQG